MHSAETLAELQKFLTLLDPSLDLQEMLANVARQLVEMFEVNHSGVLLFGHDDLEGLVIAEYPAQGAVGLKVPLTDYPLHERLKAEQRPLAVLDAQHDPVMGRVQATMQALGIQSILIIPLAVRGRLVGSLSLDAMAGARTFMPAEMELCQIIGNQIAVAVDYTHALQAAEASRQQAQTLREVNRVLSESLNLDETLPLILDQLEQVIPADASSIYLLVEEGVQLVATRGKYSPFQEQQIIPLAELRSACEVISHKTPLLVGNTHEEAWWEVYEGSPLMSWLGLPLIFRGEIVGILNIDGYSPHQFGQAHIPLAQAFASQAAIAIHNARLYGQAERRASLLASVQEIGLSMVASLELPDVLREVTTSVLTLLEAGQVRIYLYNSAEDSFTLTAVLDDAGKIKMKIAQPRSDGLTATVARSGKYLAIPNILEHPLYRDDGDIHGFRAIIGVPLRKRSEVLGVLNVFYAQPHRFTADEVDLLHLLATQAAVALENARLYSAEQARLQNEARRADQWRRIQEITSALNASLDLDEVLSKACQQFVRLIGVDHCGIILLSEDRQTGQIVAEYPLTGSVGLHIPVMASVQQVLDDRQLFVSVDVPTDLRLGQGRASLEALGVQSVLIAPLVVQDQVIGSIGLDTTSQSRHFTAEELNLCRLVADQMAIAITNARTYQAERAARVQANTLREVAAILNETLDLNEVLERILAQLERVITYNSSSIILRDKDIFRIVASRGFADPARVKGVTFAFGNKPHFQEIARLQRPLVIPDTELFIGWQREGPAAIRSWIGAPLLIKDQLIGLLAVDHMQPNFYQPADGELLTAFADLAAVALENARLYEFEVKQVEQELYIARQIQQGFFPQHIPRLPGWEIAAVCLPARETGGDFYEFVERSDNLLGLIVGDVSGKSIPAAMLMAAAQSVARAKGSDYRSPAKVMAEANRLLCDDVPDGAFVALSYALLSPNDSTVCLSSGGQLAPFLVPAADQPIHLVETPGNRLPLGVISDIDYQEMSLALTPGDLLIFHTDGVVERKDELGRLFGFEGMAAVLEKMRGQSPEVTLQALLQAADEFANGLGPADDITLVVIQRRPGNGRMDK